MRASFVRKSWIASAIVALAACSGSPTEQPVPYVTITPDQPAYFTGSVANIEVRNVTEGPVGYNLCERLIERRVLGAWTVVERQPVGGVCTDNLLTLPPGEAVTVQVQISADLPEGTYRVEFPGIVGNLDVLGPIDRASDPFQVRRPNISPEN